MSTYKGNDSTTSLVFLIFVLKSSYFCADSWLQVLESNLKNDYPKWSEIRRTSLTDVIRTDELRSSGSVFSSDWIGSFFLLWWYYICICKSNLKQSCRVITEEMIKNDHDLLVIESASINFMSRKDQYRVMQHLASFAETKRKSVVLRWLSVIKNFGCLISIKDLLG